MSCPGCQHSIRFDEFLPSLFLKFHIKQIPERWNMTKEKVRSKYKDMEEFLLQGCLCYQNLNSIREYDKKQYEYVF